MSTTIFDNPKNEIEREIADYIKPLVTPEIEEKIEKEKLTLAGCWDYCHKKGAKYKVGNCARISEEQHFAWVRGYFGAKATKSAPSASGKALSIDLDDLLE